MTIKLITHVIKKNGTVLEFEYILSYDHTSITHINITHIPVNATDVVAVVAAIDDNAMYFCYLSYVNIIL